MNHVANKKGLIAKCMTQIALEVRNQGVQQRKVSFVFATPRRVCGQPAELRFSKRE